MLKLEQKYFTQLCGLRRSYDNSKKLVDLANLRRTNLGFDTKAEHEQHAPELVNIRLRNRLDLTSLVLQRVGIDRHTDMKESQVSNLI